MHTTELRIEPVQVEDLSLLIELSVNTFIETFAAQNTDANMKEYLSTRMTEKQLSKELKNPDSEFFFAYVETECIGYLKLNFNSAQVETVFNNTAFEIERIYLLNSHQGIKLGSQLLEWCIEYGKSKNYKKLWLGVWEFNYKAIGFYKHKKFKPFDQHVFQLGTDPQTDILMQLDI